MHRIQCFLVRPVYDGFSTNFLILPYSAQCLVLSGTCHGSVLGWLLEEFHDFST